MDDDYGFATRLLIVYESKLPFDRPATLADRIEAMQGAIEALNLKEGEHADIKHIVRANTATA